MKYLRLSNFISFLSIRSITLPGVPTIMSVPFFNCLIWNSIDCPPYTGVILIFLPFARLFISSATWIASSLVGAKTMACTTFPGSNLSNIGREKAAVLPVPVCACPIISFSPSNNAGIVKACIGVGFSYPFFERAFIVFSPSPNFLNSSNFSILHVLI